MTQKLSLHTDPTGFMQAVRAASHPDSLSSVTAVEKVLRQFTADVVGRYGAVGRGELTPADAATADREACEHMGEVFTGATDEPHEATDWNGKPLADYLRGKMGVADEDDGAVVAQAFGIFVHHIYDCLRLVDEEMTKAGLEENVRSFAWALTGLDTDD